MYIYMQKCNVQSKTDPRGQFWHDSNMVIVPGTSGIGSVALLSEHKQKLPHFGWVTPQKTSTDSQKSDATLQNSLWTPWPPWPHGTGKTGTWSARNSRLRQRCDIVAFGSGVHVFRWKWQASNAKCSTKIIGTLSEKRAPAQHPEILKCCAYHSVLIKIKGSYFRTLVARIRRRTKVETPAHQVNPPDLLFKVNSSKSQLSKVVEVANTSRSSF